MSQSQNVIYYTTAQVTEMVELSDQNVRKYVRLLEDRDYEVAKDEYNRRLFSKKDVSVLQEMIKIAKSPGNTLDSAADEIIENLNNFDEDVTENSNQVTNMSDHDISRLFSLVLEKLDEIQNENKELKTNINTLVHRLEEYDRQALEYTPYETGHEISEEEEVESQVNESEETKGATEESESEPSALTETVKTEAPAPDVEETEKTVESKEETESEEAKEPEKTEVEATEPTKEETTTTEEAQKSTSVDMSQPTETTETKSENLNYGESAEKQIEEPKKGFFGKLASMFKG